MKWTYAISQKIKAALILSGVFVLVFVNNFLENRNVSQLAESFSSVYKDRLLAESYIYELSDHLYQRKNLAGNRDSEGDTKAFRASMQQSNNAIKNIITEYEKTELTETEKVVFDKVKNTLTQIQEIETRAAKANLVNQETAQEKPLLDHLYAETSGYLHQLSKIQVTEGKLLDDKSKSIIAGSNLASRLEIIVLFGIAIFIQALIFAKKSFVPKIPQQPSLN